MKKLIGKKTVVAAPLNATCAQHKISAVTDAQSDFEYEEAFNFEDTIFEKENVLKLAVTKTYICAKPKLFRGLRKNKHFKMMLVNGPEYEYEDGATFMKSGGFQKDGSFIWFYALLWKGRSIVSSEIELNGSKISFLCPNLRLCCTSQDMVSSTEKSETATFSLGKAIIESIKNTCEHWDKLFFLKSDSLEFNNRYTKKSLGFYEFGKGDGVWNRNQANDDFQDVIDMSFHWPYPVNFHRKTWWTVG